MENISDLHSEAVPLELSEAETQWAAGLRGCQAMRCAAVAAQCEMQLAGRCLLLVGYYDEVVRGREYALRVIRARCDGGVRKSALSAAGAGMPEDYSILFVPKLKAPRLRPDQLQPIEKATKTVVLFDKRAGSAVEPSTRRRFISGSDAVLRDVARARILSIVGAERSACDVAPALAAPLAEIKAKLPEKLKRVKDEAALLRSHAEDVGLPKAVVQERMPSTSLSGEQKTNPAEVLVKIGKPEVIAGWSRIQSKVWAGHPRFPAAGWIRIWSENKQCTYYLRLSDKTATFELSEVI